MLGLPSNPMGINGSPSVVPEQQHPCHLGVGWKCQLLGPGLPLAAQNWKRGCGEELGKGRTLSVPKHKMAEDFIEWQGVGPYAFLPEALMDSVHKKLILQDWLGAGIEHNHQQNIRVAFLSVDFHLQADSFFMKTGSSRLCQRVAYIECVVYFLPQMFQESKIKFCVGQQAHIIRTIWLTNVSS